MKKQRLLLHVGPYKTGTSAIQNWLQDNSEMLRERGVLIPRAGYTGRTTWSTARHFQLAASTVKHELWAEVVAEARDSDASTVLISAERFSTALPDILDQIAGYLREFDTRLIVFLRDEVAMSRSMYLQLVKAAVNQGKLARSPKLDSFGTWWKRNRKSMSYARLLRPWIAEFGADSIDFAIYKPKDDFDSVEVFRAVTGLPEGSVPPDRRRVNPSIGAFSATLLRDAAAIDPDFARSLLDHVMAVERSDPVFGSWPLAGFDAKRIARYYAEQTRSLERSLPVFGKALRKARGKPESKPPAPGPGGEGAEPTPDDRKAGSRDAKVRDPDRHKPLRLPASPGPNARPPALLR